MCGIVCRTLASRDACPDPEIARVSLAPPRYREPHDKGIFEAPGVFFRYTGVAVTGRSRGRQPVANETGAFQAIFSGETYNHHEVRRELVALGHRMDSDSDSAVPAHAYEKGDAAFLERPEDIFAIAIWNAETRWLVLCRDRFGIKPLYRAVDHDRLVFGSELTP